MKKLLIIFLFLILCLSVQSQMIISRNSHVPVTTTAPPSGNIYTDDFESYTADDTLTNQGNWIAALHGQRVIDESGDNRLKGMNASGTQVAATYYNQTVEDDQYSEITLDYVGTNAWCGVAVRVSGTRLTNDYLAYVLEFAATGDIILYSINNDTQTSIGTGTVNTALQAGDVLRLEVSGTTLSCYQNGSLITSIDTDGMVTNADISTGFPGVSSRNDNAGMYMDDWEGGDL